MAKRYRTVWKPTHEEFVFEVRRPSASYGFSLQPLKHDPDAYWEHQSLEFVATCIYPDRFEGRDATGRLSGERQLMDLDLRRGAGASLKGVGFMEAGKSKFHIDVGLPFDACWNVGAAMAAGTITSMLTNGPILHRGKALVTSVSFHGPEFDPRAYVG
jgi:hypothetical protein